MILRDVRKVYSENGLTVKTLNGVTLDVERGDFICIMGPSGSGKTTLLNIIATLDVPTSGEVWVCGKKVSEMDERKLARFRLKNIGVVFQFYNLIPELTALDNVALPLIINGETIGKSRKKALELLSKFGLRNKAKSRPNQLSGGERQRVAIARALANNSEIILCDEPTGNLDSVTGGKIVSLIKYIGRLTGATVIVVTHDRDVALKADRILYMRDGRVFEREESRVGVEKQMLYEVTEIMARSLPLIKEIISPSKYEEVKKDLLEVLEKLEDERDVF